MLSKENTQKSVEALSNIEEKQWAYMATTAKGLKDFVQLGGMSEAITTMTNTLKESVKLEIQSVISPLMNDMNAIVTDAINDVLGPLMPYLNEGFGVIGEAIGFVIFSLYNLGMGIGYAIQDPSSLSIWSFWSNILSGLLPMIADRLEQINSYVPGPGGRESGYQEY